MGASGWLRQSSRYVRSFFNIPDRHRMSPLPHGSPTVGSRRPGYHGRHRVAWAGFVRSKPLMSDPFLHPADTECPQEFLAVCHRRGEHRKTRIIAPGRAPRVFFGLRGKDERPPRKRQHASCAEVPTPR
jgi:hypothetical protein